MRLSLTLPKAAINEAMLHVTDLAPGAEVGQLVEIPAEPPVGLTTADRRMFVSMHAAVGQRAARRW